MSAKPLFSARVCRIITFLNKNFADPISLEETSFKAANLSGSHAEKIFRQEVGIPIKRYLILKRVFEAACLLRSDPKISENDLLNRCGFADVSNFIRQFRNCCGCTPIKFRNCNRDLESCWLWKRSCFYRLLKNARLREALGIDIYAVCLLMRTINAKK